MPTRMPAVTAALVLLTSAHADTIHVPEDQPTIQDALDAAVAGDFIVLESGTYSIEEGLFFTESGVTLRGETGDPNDVILDAAGSELPIQLTDRTGMTFAGMTFTNAYTVIRAVGGDVSFVACRFHDNSSTGGSNGALIAILADIEIDSCVFDSNTALTESTGAAIVGYACGVTIIGSEFRDNSVPESGVISQSSGAAIFAGIAFDLMGKRTPTTLHITDSLFLNNSAALGGAIRNSGGPTTIDRCRFIGNSSSLGGAIITDAVTSGPEPLLPVLTVTNSVFNANSAFRLGAFNGIGGAIACSTAESCILLNNTFVNNEAESIAGAVEISDTTTAAVANCLLSGNEPASTPIRGNYSATNNLDAPATAIMFTDPPGPDAIPGTADDDHSLLRGSPAIDAGDNASLPSGLSLDVAGLARFVDDPETTDTGSGDAPIVDIGAHEYTPPPPCNAADLALPFGLLDLADVTAFITAFTSLDPAADLEPDGLFDLADIVAFVQTFLAGCPSEPAAS